MRPLGIDRSDRPAPLRPGALDGQDRPRSASTGYRAGRLAVHVDRRPGGAGVAGVSEGPRARGSGWWPRLARCSGCGHCPATGPGTSTSDPRRARVGNWCSRDPIAGSATRCTQQSLPVAWTVPGLETRSGAGPALWRWWPCSRRRRGSKNAGCSPGIRDTPPIARAHGASCRGLFDCGPSAGHAAKPC